MRPPLTRNLFAQLWPRLIAATALVVLTGLTWRAAFGSDELLNIATQCVDTHRSDYCQVCRQPREEASCPVEASCGKRTQIWASDDLFVAVRDIKMCGCPSNFVHGLVMPRAPVTGVEDPKRPDGIWAFAWSLGLQRIGSQELALAVNPQAHRSQNQLHVHLVRLKPHALDDLAQAHQVSVARLDSVWAAAGKLAQEAQWSDYGVLVSAGVNGQYWVTITQDSPERRFTEYACR